MNNKILSILLGTLLVLIVVSSCGWSVGGASGLSYDKNKCSSDLKKLISGTYSPSDVICDPIDFEIKKNKNYITVRGKHSQGHFDINTNAGSKKIFLQAPHIWSDEGTGLILDKLKNKLKPHISFKNSVHRNNKSTLAINKSINYDLGKRKDSILVLLSKNFINESPSGSIVQLHGFAANKRKSIKGKNADLIISSGSYNQSLRVKKITKCLKQNSGSLQIFSFPNEVTELGGTKNVLSKLNKVRGESVFVHLEMSKRYRNLVSKNKKVFEHLASCIEDLSHVK